MNKIRIQNPRTELLPGEINGWHIAKNRAVQWFDLFERFTHSEGNYFVSHVDAPPLLLIG
jgi:hypothetical protein